MDSTQHLNTSTTQRLNASTTQRLNTSTPQRLNNCIFQFNDKFVDIEEIQKSILTVTAQYEFADPKKISFSLKIDKKTPMILVDRLKNKIKKTDFRKVHYVALK